MSGLYISHLTMVSGGRTHNPGTPPKGTGPARSKPQGSQRSCPSEPAMDYCNPGNPHVFSQAASEIHSKLWCRTAGISRSTPAHAIAASHGSDWHAAPGNGFSSIRGTFRERLDATVAWESWQVKPQNPSCCSGRTWTHSRMNHRSRVCEQGRYSAKSCQ